MGHTLAKETEPAGVEDLGGFYFSSFLVMVQLWIPVACRPDYIWGDILGGSGADTLTMRKETNART